jgi:hypothetical protein
LGRSASDANDPASAAGGSAAGPSQCPTNELDTGRWLRIPGAQLLAEKWFAWHTSRALLEWYERVHRDEPQLAGRSLYERVLTRRSDIDIPVAAGILRRAEQSFCDWPSGRDLRFRDLVQYVVVDEYLRSHVATLGTHTNLGRVVARLIPEEL